MPPVTDHDTALRRIAELAAEAIARPDIPASLQPVLGEIARLAGSQGGDTPEPSDVPHTENQSL